MAKGILKRHSLSGISIASSGTEVSDSSSQEDSPKPKRVSFDGAEPARVFEADEWDRSPAEVTLRLTYRDVVELRELNVSLVRTGPLAMERTPSRRPTRQRTPTPTTTQPSIPPSTGSLQRDSSPAEHHDRPVPRPPSPTITPPSARLASTYQYQASLPQSLPPLLEDASLNASSPADPGSRTHGMLTPDPYFELHSAPLSSTPPGLPLRAPRLKAVPSPALAPPSPLMLSPLSLSSSPSPKPTTHSVSPVLLYIHPKPTSISPRFRTQSPPSRLKPLVFPALSKRASVPDIMASQLEKGDLTSQTRFDEDNPPSTWKPLGLAGVDANSSSPALSLSKNTLGSPPTVTPAITRRNTKSLMGWELKRTGSGSGKLGFGIVRKGSTGA